MSFDLAKQLAGKQAFRRDLAALPLVEKLRLLDALRERELAIRGQLAPEAVPARRLQENPLPYRTEAK
jgi:uncharacterized protein (DUF2461 family)